MRVANEHGRLQWTEYVYRKVHSREDSTRKCINSCSRHGKVHAELIWQVSSASTRACRRR